MAIGVYFSFADATLDQYDEACRRLNDGQPMRALSDWPGGGCLEHSAWAEESGSLNVFDVWESPEAFQQFGEKLMPIQRHRLGFRSFVIQSCPRTVHALKS